MKIDKVYIITYDDNLRKVGRVIIELANIGIYNIEIVKGINRKDITFYDYNDLGKRISYPYEGSVHKMILSSDVNNQTIVPSNCACMLSHKIAFDRAKEKGYNNIMIVEDDLLLGYKVDRYLEQVLSDAPDDWDMLRLEWNLAREMGDIKLENNHWFSCDNVWSTAWMIFNKRAIDHIVEVTEDKPRPSFDQLTNKQCKNLNSYTSLRSMGIQYHL